MLITNYSQYSINTESLKEKEESRLQDEESFNPLYVKRLSWKMTCLDYYLVIKYSW